MDLHDLFSSNIDAKTVDDCVASLSLKPTHALFLNQKKIGKTDFLASFPSLRQHPFVDNGFYYDKSTYDFGRSFLFEAGGIYIQDASAMVVASILEAEKRRYVIDLCAAPGGKSVGVGLSLKEGGILISNDISPTRAKELSGNIERMGLDNCIVCSSSPSRLASIYGPIFDGVILDAPCSGGAMARKNPSARIDWSKEKSLNCAATQKELLEDAYALLAPGGVLIYSTCSFSKEENEDNVAAFLSRHGDLVGERIEDIPGAYYLEESHSMAYLLPSLFEGEGQFIAKIKKKEGICRDFEIRGKKNAKLPKEIEKQALSFLYSSRALIEHNSSIYDLPSFFPLPPSCFRPGVKIFDKENPYILDFALSRALPNANSLRLNPPQARAYLRGESFLAEAKDGIVLLSYKGLNLGFGKAVKGVIKNHYPKGLRKDIALDY